ncbi:hypothetical protein [Marinicellulosiphila megalodicopiae]|uniref:hypothetical protein n=1 Tax=Marinicellulosiphila megalodicopiae TaxID=2724896 RepID=UPI003BB00347
MIEFLASMTPLSWWIIIIFLVLYYLLPFFKHLEFNSSSITILKSDKQLGSDSLNKFTNNDYYSLCLELVQSWQWQIKMKLNISFQSFGYAQINQYILNQINPVDSHWVTQLLDDNLTFEEKNELEKNITLQQYSSLQSAIKQDIKQGVNHD